MPFQKGPYSYPAREFSIDSLTSVLGRVELLFAIRYVKRLRHLDSVHLVKAVDRFDLHWVFRYVEWD